MNKQQMLGSVRNYLLHFGRRPNERIIKAMEKIDRKNFMDENKNFAYVDSAIPIGYGQTISQPSTVAIMLTLLELKKGDSVLEVGTGSGWNAALISYLITPGNVQSLEVVHELAEKAREHIKRQGLENVVIKEDDFRKLKEKFDKIIFTAGISEEQEQEIEDFAQRTLKQNGILICPYQNGPLLILKNKRGRIEESYTREGYIFVPLIL